MSKKKKNDSSNQSAEQRSQAPKPSDPMGRQQSSEEQGRNRTSQRKSEPDAR